MSHIWTFSESSKEAVNKFIAAARPPDDNNKWIQRFGLKNCAQSNITSTEINDEKSVINTISLIEDSSPHKWSQELNIESYQEFTESIEEEPTSKFDLFVNECLKDYKLLTHLAEKLSNSSIEKIISHIYDSNRLDATFIEEFHRYFIPQLLRRQHNCLTQDILIKSHKIYPKAFKTLLVTIIKDITISNKVLEDLIESCNEKELSEIVITVTDLELSTEEFIHNIFSIYTAYKGCKKTEQIQNLILPHILQHSHSSATDKNYGRLLLAFLQTEKDIQSLNDYRQIEKIVETHRSAFKRPCMNCLQELIERFNVMDTTVNTQVI